MKNLREISFMFIISFLYFPLLMIFLLVAIEWLLPTKTESRDSEIYEYQYLRIEDLNKTSQGMVSFPLKITDEEFFWTNEGRVMFSEFGLDEYECYGSCFCDEEEERRAIGSVNALSRGMMILVAAVSTSLALKSAERTFQEECERTSSSCDSSYIKSEVSKCERNLLQDDILEIEESQDGSWRKQEKKKKKNPFIRFSCTGNCIKNEELKSSQSMKVVEEFGCEKLSITSIVEKPRYPSDLEHEEFPRSFSWSSGAGDGYALTAFAAKKLDPFCRKSSIFKVDGKTRQLCVSGYRRDQKQFWQFDKSIRCRKLYD